jgi:hypothetical protein
VQWERKFETKQWLGSFQERISTDIDARAIQLGFSDRLYSSIAETLSWIIPASSENLPTFNSLATIANEGTGFAFQAGSLFIERWNQGVSTLALPPIHSDLMEEIASNFINAKKELAAKSVTSSIALSGPHALIGPIHCIGPIRAGEHFLQ